MYAQERTKERNKTTGARSGYGYCTLETLEGETLVEYNNTGKNMGNIMQARLEVFLREVDSEGQQHSKNKKIMQWVGPPYPSRGRRSRINFIDLAKKESKTGAYRYRHNKQRHAS